MSLTKWNPMMDRFPSLSSFVENVFSNPEGWNTRKQPNFLPAINVCDNESDYNIEVAAPGLKKEDFKIAVKKGVLDISAIKEEKTEKTEDNYTRKEFNYQSFSRSFLLPESVDIENINATYEDGILKINIPKILTQKAPIKTIPIS